MWFKGEGFTDRVKQWWDLYHVSGSPSSMLVQKLKLLKLDLKRWNVEVFGDVNAKKNEVLSRIQDLDMVEEQRILSSEERSSHQQYKAEYKNLLLLEEISWRQKSQVTWLEKGIRIPAFFIVWLIQIVDLIPLIVYPLMGFKLLIRQ